MLQFRAALRGVQPDAGNDFERVPKSPAYTRCLLASRQDVSPPKGADNIALQYLVGKRGVGQDAIVPLIVEHTGGCAIVFVGECERSTKGREGVSYKAPDIHTQLLGIRKTSRRGIFHENRTFRALPLKT